MSDQTYNKVDLSLDEIIKLNRKEKKQQIRTRGGSVRGGSVRGRGRGLQGQRIQGRGRGGRGAGGRGAGGRGGGGRGAGGRGAGGKGAWGRGAGGVSPLNRQKLQTGTVSATAALRGQGRGAGRRGQGGIRRGVVGTRRGLRGGLTRGGRGGRGGGRVRGTANIRNNRGILRGSLRGRGTRGNLRGALRGRGGVNNQGQGQGQASKGQGQVLTNQAQGWGGRGQGRGAGNRFSLKQKREWALQTLRQARQAIAQLDQQTARQNFVNARRGIAQQNQPLTTKKNQGMYSSTMSLTSNKSNPALTSTRQLQGTQVTTFNPVSSQQSPRGRRRWRQKKAQTNLPINNGSTLTISIDNSTPLSAMNYGAPQAAVPVPSPPQQQQQPQQQRQRLRRRPWPRQSQTMMPTSAPAMSSGGQEFQAGASAEFSQQLMNMKPTVSTKYVFEKTAFSTANTSCSLNDRFSGSSTEILMGRKVFL